SGRPGMRAGRALARRRRGDRTILRTEQLARGSAPVCRRGSRRRGSRTRRARGRGQPGRRHLCKGCGMRTIGIIPARMGSSRFPGKPLATIGGVPMLGHVYFRARLNRRLDGVYIATCDEEIRRYALEIGAECVMTSPCHERASDRTAEAAGLIERGPGARIDVVVMIQGDEPMIHPEMIDE